MGGQMELFGAGEVQTFKSVSNPMIAAYGEGPEGARCRTCAHLTCEQYKEPYYKCKFVGWRDGMRRSHNYYWPACGKYELSK
jgi:hypothetical protein